MENRIHAEEQSTDISVLLLFSSRRPSRVWPSPDFCPGTHQSHPTSLRWRSPPIVLALLHYQLSIFGPDLYDGLLNRVLPGDSELQENQLLGGCWGEDRIQPERCCGDIVLELQVFPQENSELPIMYYCRQARVGSSGSDGWLLSSLDKSNIFFTGCWCVAFRAWSWCQW